MSEHLLQAVLALVDQLESAVVSHYSISQFPSDHLARLVSQKILCEGADATEIPRPERFGPGPDLTIVRTSRGIEGVAGEGDYFQPIQLLEEDIRQYEVSLPHLIDAIRKESDVEGRGYRNDNGLIFVGQKSVTSVGLVDVYLSLPNSNEDSVMARCRRLIAIAGERRMGLLTPRILDLSREDLGILAASRIVTISLMAAASKGHFTVNWDEVFGSASDAAAFASTGTTKGDLPDLERLIDGKKSVSIATAARYLQRSSGQVERLVRDGTLRRVGQGRPTQVSTASLRIRKGTQEEPDS